MIAIGRTRRGLAAAGWLACAAWLAGCSADVTGGGGSAPAADTGSPGIPGFDGFAIDIKPTDTYHPDAATPDDAAADLADDTTDAVADDAAVDVADDVTTVDTPDSGAGPGTCSNPCVIPDDCNPAEDPCTATICQFGCCTAAATTGDPCDDKVLCNGPDACKNGKCTGAAPNGCDDGLICTTDSCEKTDTFEKCHHDVLSDWCQIGTTCVQANASIPGNPCKICDPAQDQDSWSYLAGCCQKDSDCTAKGACDKPSCDVAAGKCLIVKIAGCCKTNADCDDGDACTTDACDGGTGNCNSVAISCPGPSECQLATCDPADGVCKPDLLPGWCFVDGICASSGDVNPNNSCQFCVPLNKPNAWTANPGTFCNDNNACTFSDVCTSAGTCKGTAQPGCCQSDGDCDGGGVACKIGVCNTSVGLCTIGDKPGCCTAGVCCDTVAQLVLPLGTACGSSIIGSDYQCSGADVQKRDYTPGCTGISPTSCTSSIASGNPGPWATISTCGAGTLCTPQGSGIPPSCVVQGSCAGACGGAGTMGCTCTSGCVPGVNCCPDFEAVCACTSGDCCTSGYVLQGTTCQPTAATQFQCSGKTLQKRVASGQCVGAPTCATDPGHLIWGGWQTVETCANSCTVAGDSSSGSCVAPAGTCNGVCGGWWTNQTCHCDTSCVAQGNCCADYYTQGCDKVTGCYVDSAHSCYDPGNGYMCGSPAANGCSCDITTCKAAGTCCPDAGFCCYF